MKDNSKEFEYIEGPIVAYKAFDKDFCCHGKQYEVGQSYNADVDVKSLSKGFYGFIPHKSLFPNNLYVIGNSQIFDPEMFVLKTFCRDFCFSFNKF